jgi:histidinol phosphatase-like enzyme
MSKLVICDRDGTINVDNNYYLGSQNNWRSLIEFMPGVLLGIRVLNEDGVIPHVFSAQAGVAQGRMTEIRAHEVMEEILRRVGNSGLSIGSYRLCFNVTSKYATEKRAKGAHVLDEYVRDTDRRIKPGVGMIEEIAAENEYDLNSTQVFVIGDRKSDLDVCLGLPNGYGILVNSLKTRELDDAKRVETELISKFPDKFFIANDFYEAAKIILDI